MATTSDAAELDTEGARQLCAQLVAAGELHLVTQISAGIPDFLVDDFDRVPPRVEGMADGADAFRATCTGAARLITAFTDRHEKRLEDARTGRLIRVVLHADGGAAYCYSVVDGQYVVGFVFLPPNDRAATASLALDRHPAVNLADHAMTTLVDNLRAQFGLPAQNAGGWSSEEQWSPPATAGEDLVAAAADPADLHYLARHCTAGPPRTHDSFDEPGMSHYFHLRTRQARRKFYDELSADMLGSVGQVNRLMRTTVGGTVRRVVFDVEQGAVIYYRLGPGDYLVGVTLNQDRVGATDGRLGWLATQLAPEPR